MLRLDGQKYASTSSIYCAVHLELSFNGNCSTAFKPSEIVQQFRCNKSLESVLFLNRHDKAEGATGDPGDDAGTHHVFREDQIQDEALDGVG